jgi:putative aminopeptidase FrvX
VGVTTPARRTNVLDALLKSLIPAYGPPGRETGVRVALRAALRGMGRVTEDALGNLHLHLEGRGPRLLLVAAMDAPGVIVTRHESNGTARIDLLGGRSAAEMVGATVAFPDGARALVAYDRPSNGKDSGSPEAGSLYLVTGLDKNAAAKRIPVGSVGMVESRIDRLGDHWCSPSLEHRAGAAAVVAALKRTRRPAYDLHVIFAAQSELGSRGALTGAFGVEPELAIVVELAHVGDGRDQSSVALGEGPCVGLKEHGYIAHPRGLELARKAAKAARVPIQYLVRDEGSTDAGAVRRAGAGVPTVLIAIPARKTGGPDSLVHARDLERTVDLVARLLVTPPAAVPAARPKSARRGGKG